MICCEEIRCPDKTMWGVCATKDKGQKMKVTSPGRNGQTLMSSSAIACNEAVV